MYAITSYSAQSDYDEIALFFTRLSQSHQQADVALMRKITHQLNLLAELGPQLGMPHSKKLKGLRYSLYELRPIPERIFYTITADNQIILLHHYTKRQNKTNSRQIKTAIRHYDVWLKRKEFLQ